MYEKVRSAGMRKRDYKLFIAIAVCVLILAVTTAPIIFSANYQHRYRLFQNSLAESTVYARENNSLAMELDGVSTPLDIDGGYHKLFLKLVEAGAGRTGEPPEGSADVIITFGNDASLELWGVKLIGYVDTDAEYGLFLRYTYPDGKIYAYDTDEITIERAIELLRYN